MLLNWNGTIAEDCLCLTVPVAIAAAAFQASIYDVPGGYRAVMFDRFSGVKDKVSIFSVQRDA